jgi:hypothetical protein
VKQGSEAWGDELNDGDYSLDKKTEGLCNPLAAEDWL